MAMNRVKRATRVALTALVVAPALLAGQAPQQRIDQALSRALEAGVPVSLLESKVAEGRAKGVPLERIASAVEQRLATLERVQTAFGERAQLSAQELGVAGDALQAGVSEVALRTISERAPRDRRAVAIATLAHLVQLGYSSETALERVSEALEQGSEALMNLPAQAQGRGRATGRPEGVPGRGQAGEGGRGGPPASVPAGGRATDPGSQGRGRGGPPVP
jgi:hypothetical protein